MAYNIYEEAVSELFKSMKVVMYLPAVLSHSKPLRLLSNNLAMLKNTARSRIQRKYRI